MKVYMKIQEYTSLGELKKDLIKSNNIKKTDTEFEIIVCQNIMIKFKKNYVKNLDII
jgi:chemotaxis methyl-accepting protein methylase